MTSLRRWLSHPACSTQHLPASSLARDGIPSPKAGGTTREVERVSIRFMFDQLTVDYLAERTDRASFEEKLRGIHKSVA